MVKIVLKSSTLAQTNLSLGHLVMPNFMSHLQAASWQHNLNLTSWPRAAIIKLQKQQRSTGQNHQRSMECVFFP